MRVACTRLAYYQPLLLVLARNADQQRRFVALCGKPLCAFQLKFSFHSILNLILVLTAANAQTCRKVEASRYLHLLIPLLTNVIVAYSLDADNQILWLLSALGPLDGRISCPQIVAVYLQPLHTAHIGCTQVSSGNYAPVVASSAVCSI